MVALYGLMGIGTRHWSLIVGHNVNQACIFAEGGGGGGHMGCRLNFWASLRRWTLLRGLLDLFGESAMARWEGVRMQLWLMIC